MDTLSWPVILGLVCLVYAALAVIAGLYVADVKNRSPAEGFWFPLLFGPIGVLIVACLPAGNYRESQAASDPDEIAERIRVASLDRSTRERQSSTPDKVAQQREARRLLGEVDE